MTVFTAERDIPATPQAVFDAFQDPERLARWWGPDGFRNTFSVFEFRPGGRWVFTMHGPDGTDYPNASEFTAIAPGQGLTIRHVVPPLFTLTVELQALAEGTRVLWTQVFDDPAFAQAVRHIVEPANAQNLQRLATEVG